MIHTGAAAAVPAVRVVTKDSMRVKRISAEVQVQASVEQVWSVLTGYNTLADFIPNLDLCERVAGAPPGKQRLRQRACSQSLYWRLQAEAILDVQQVVRTLGRRELHFVMVEGDFQEFSGRWIVEPDPSVKNGLATSLRYEVSIVPKWSLPSTLITTVVRCGLPSNVRAIAEQAEKLAQKRRAAPRFASAAFVEGALPDSWTKIQAPKPVVDDILPSKGPARSPAELTENSQLRLLKNEGLREYLGLNSVPLPHPVPKKAKRWEKVLPLGDNSPTSISSQMPGSQDAGSLDHSLEVHLRKLDDPLTLHRRVVASVAVNATVEEVWNVLTDYEGLPEIVPNLIVSQRLPTPAGAPGRLIRLRQVGHKSFMYMHLYAEATLALVETPHKEIQFKQITGDFQTLQGKIMIQQDTFSSDVILKYAVEVEIPRSTALTGILDPLLERIVYQDIPTNLSAVKTRIESICQVFGTGESPETSKSAFLRDADTDTGDESAAALEDEAETAMPFPELKAELHSLFGEDGPLPKLSSLQQMDRKDLEEAIAAHGGVRQVAKLMGWRVVGKNPSPWYTLRSTREVFDAFAEEEGLPRHCLPNHDMLRRCGRKDMVKGAEEWGGLEELAELLEYKVAGDVTMNSDYRRQLAARDTQELAERKRPTSKAMCESFDDFAAELRQCFGNEGPLPSSTELRAMKRNDIEKAISHHGGNPEVSKRMGWKQTYRPPNYWADLGNCKAELDSFCREVGAPQGVVPSVYSMQQAGRYDLQRAVRHWGGLTKLADALNYKVPGSRADVSYPRPRSSQNGQRGAERQDVAKRKARNSSKEMRDEIDSW